MNNDRLTHWQNVYAAKPDTEVSWFQEDPAPSLELVAATSISAKADIIDVGGGASRLVDRLLDRGFSRLTVLDISAIGSPRTSAHGSLRQRSTCGTIALPFIS